MTARHPKVKFRPSADCCAVTSLPRVAEPTRDGGCKYVTPRHPNLRIPDLAPLVPRPQLTADACIPGRAAFGWIAHTGRRFRSDIVVPLLYRRPLPPVPLPLPPRPSRQTAACAQCATPTRTWWRHGSYWTPPARIRFFPLAERLKGGRGHRLQSACVPLTIHHSACRTGPVVSLLVQADRITPAADRFPTSALRGDAAAHRLAACLLVRSFSHHLGSRSD